MRPPRLFSPARGVPVRPRLRRGETPACASFEESRAEDGSPFGDLVGAQHGAPGRDSRVSGNAPKRPWPGRWGKGVCSGFGRRPVARCGKHTVRSMRRTTGPTDGPGPGCRRGGCGFAVAERGRAALCADSPRRERVEKVPDACRTLFHVSGRSGERFRVAGMRCRSRGVGLSGFYTFS